MEAVLQDVVRGLHSMLQGINVVNLRDRSRNTILHIAVKKENRKLFDYLLTIDGVKLDVQNVDGFTPLMFAVKLQDEHYALELIKRGADVTVATLRRRETALHFAVELNNEAVVEALIKSGAHINFKNYWEITPLHIACRRNSPLIPLLLFHGAEATIVTFQGTTAFDLSLLHCPPEVQEIVYSYTFDHLKDRVNLRTMIIAMVHQPSFFFKLSENNCVVADDPVCGNDFSFLESHLYQIRPEIFKEFMNRNPGLVEEFFEIYNPLNIIPTVCIESDLKFFYMLCESPYIQLIFEGSYVSKWSVSYQNQMSKFWQIVRKSEEIAIHFVCCLLSYGFRLFSADLLEIFWIYGYGELFSILLHMDLQPILSYHLEFQVFHIRPYFMLPALIQDFNITIDVLYAFPTEDSQFFDKIGKLFEHPVIKAYKRKSLKNKQDVNTSPSLLELSREATRRFLIKRFQIRNSVQFFTMLEALPIAPGYKDILSYKQPIYWKA